MEIAEAGIQFIKQQYLLFAPAKQSLFICPVFYDPEQHFADEHRDGVLENAVPDAHQGIFGGKVPYGVEAGPWVLAHIRLQHIQRQEEGCRHPFADAPDKESASPVFPAQGVYHQGILSDLCRMEYDDVRIDRHILQNYYIFVIFAVS